MAANRPTRPALFIFAIIATLLLVPQLLGYYVDLLWFDDLGLSSVYGREITTKLMLGGVTGGFVFLFLHLNLWYAQRNASAHPIRLRATPAAEPVDLTGSARKLGLVFSLLFAASSALAATGWLTALQFIHATPFGIQDPVLGLDVSYYVFKLPFLQWMLALFTSLVMLTLIALAAIYWLRGEVVLFPRRIVVEPAAGNHLAVLVALMFVVVAARTSAVTIPELLLSSSDQLHGAGYTDIHARLPMLRVATFAALAAAAFVIFGAFRRKMVYHTVLATGAYAAITVLALGIYPTLLQRFIVDPDELTRETPQIAHHLTATRRAWGLDSVTVRDLSGEAQLSLADLRRNSSTIENVRLWDRDPLLQTFGQLQEIRTYYDFVSVDDDRYVIDGRYRQVLLSARELNTASLPARNFINTHLTFTHGMGLTMGPVNQVTSEGLPVLFVKDLPPQTSVSLDVTRPQIYFGELTNEFAIVDTEKPEFDYPTADKEATTVHAGDAGIPLGSIFRRAILAAHLGSANVLISPVVTGRSRLLMRRQIDDRAGRALPFLRFDGDPYLVVTDDGLLKWIMDAYTFTSRYPYSRPASGGGPNYMRNSAKVVVDAYDGSVTAYMSDAEDPIIRTFDKAFPGVLQPMSAMPADVRRHVRYPEDLFRAQTALFGIYHMLEPSLFYSKEDLWQIPSLDDNQGSGGSPFLRHIVMRLPEEDSAEFIFMTPYTPRGKENLAAWLVVRNDGEHYGELVVYRFPKQSLVFGPRQVVNRMNQDTEIARQFTLWGQRGTVVERGQLLVIPIEESLIYVQPIYLRAEGGRIPELKRVIVAYQNRVAMEETLERGLSVIFGGAVASPATPDVSAPATATTPAAGTGSGTLDSRTREMLREMQAHYDRAIAAQRAGNWAEYGNEMQRMSAILRELSNRIPPAP